MTIVIKVTRTGTTADIYGGLGGGNSYTPNKGTGPDTATIGTTNYSTATANISDISIGYLTNNGDFSRIDL